MPTPTYDLIASSVLGSTATSVTFSSIPTSYRDLILVEDVLASGGNLTSLIRFNNDSGNNYRYTQMFGYFNSVETSNTGTLSGVYGATPTTSIRSLCIYQIFDYQIGKHKPVLVRDNKAQLTGTGVSSWRWENTSAITSLTVTVTTQQYAAGSTFYLYGIAG